MLVQDKFDGFVVLTNILKIIMFRTVAVKKVN
jgi:hypothetical protein